MSACSLRIVRPLLALAVLVGFLCLLAALTPAIAQTPSGSVSGSVDVASPDEQPFIVPGVTLTLTCASPAGGSIVHVTVTDTDGKYRIDDVPSGACSIVAELQGFQSTTKSLAIESGRDVEVALRLGFDTLREDVTVTASSATLLETSGSATARIEQSTLQRAPIASERFQDALPLIPGVVRGPDGLLNINGSRSNQTGLTVNNASGTDPVTGEFALEVPIDAIQSVNVQQTAYAPEFGQSGGAMATIETQQGGDAWRVQVNNFKIASCATSVGAQKRSISSKAASHRISAWPRASTGTSSWSANGGRISSCASAIASARDASSLFCTLTRTWGGPFKTWGTPLWGAHVLRRLSSARTAGRATARDK